MRRFHAKPSRVVALGALMMAMAVVGLGAGPGRRKPTVEPLKPLKVDETIGDMALVSSVADVSVEGVGLVVGLDGTGSDPEPGYYREKLLEQMRKAGVEDSEKLLGAPGKSMSLVIVRAKIPAGVTRRDKIDVDLELTPASTTKSLAGGWLVSARLSEILVAKGEAHEGSTLAVAGGPVMAGTDAQPDNLRVGRVLGGCRVKKDMPFALWIDRNHRSKRIATRIETVVNERFHQNDGSALAGMATAKTDDSLTLKVPRIYHHNQARYFQVIKLLPVVSNPTLTAQRTERWGKELLDPKVAGISALRLEGLGPNAAETLKKGLASDNAQVRFFAAEALAYLDDPSGVDVLADSAVKVPEFRAFALAALAATDEAAATMRLRKLMDHPDAEVRYGAFNALRTHDENDVFLGRVPVAEPEPEEDPEADPLSIRIATAGQKRRRDRGRPEDPFTLYIVRSEGPPLVHVSRKRRCEIVVFGEGQRLLTPVVLGGGGPILLNAADGDTQVEISRIVASKFDDADLKSSTSLAIGDVIKEAARLGATYPEVLAILQAADRQKNLSGPLVVDAAPVASPKYDDALLRGIDPTVKKDDAVKPTKLEPKDEPKARPRRRLLDRLRRSSAR